MVLSREGMLSAMLVEGSEFRSRPIHRTFGKSPVSPRVYRRIHSGEYTGPTKYKLQNVKLTLHMLHRERCSSRQGMQVIRMKAPVAYYVVLAVFSIMALSAGMIGHLL